MRRKLLLLSVVIILTAVAFLGYRFCSGRASEAAGDSTSEPAAVAEIEIPKTGEITELIEIALTEDEGSGCDAEAVSWPEIMLGNGENSAEDVSSLELDSDSGIAFWGAEAPAAITRTDGLDMKDSGKTEAVIIILGVLSEIAVLGAGKFIFDRYAR